MKLTTDQGELSLPRDLSIDISSVNPFFGEDGTVSMPLTLPPTLENFRALGYPNRSHRSSSLVKRVAAVFSHGTLSRRCTIVIDSASDEGMSLVLAFNESELYARAQEKRLPDLFSGRRFDNILDVDSLLHEAQHTDSTEAGAGHFVMFPVAADLEGEGAEARIKTVLNGDDEPDPLTYEKFTPFIYLSYLLDSTFRYCGFEVVENIFASDTVLRDVVVLNRCADAFWDSAYSGSRRAPDPGRIVPDVTVGELISWLHDKFGAIVTCDADGIRIRLFRDLVNLPVDDRRHVLTGANVRGGSVSFPEPGSLIQSCDTSLESAGPAAGSLDELRRRFSTLSVVDNDTDIVSDDFIYVRSLGKYYHNRALMGTDAYPYIRTVDGIEGEELNCNDLFVPMVKVGGKLMPYVGKSRYSVARISGTGDDPEFEPDKRDPIMICYGLHVAASGDTPARNIGTQYGFTDTGVAVPDRHPPLIPERLVDEYFKEWQAIRLNAFPERTCRLLISQTDLSLLDLCRPYLLDGQKVLFKSIRYTLDRAGVGLVDATFLVLPVYDTMITVPDIGFDEPRYGWRRVNTYDESFVLGRIFSDDGLTDYTDDDAPPYKASAAGQVAKLRTRALTYIVEPQGTLETYRYAEYFISERLWT